MGIKETQTHSSEPMQCSDLQPHTGLLIAGSGFESPGAHHLKPQVDDLFLVAMSACSAPTDPLPTLTYS